MPHRQKHNTTGTPFNIPHRQKHNITGTPFNIPHQDHRSQPLNRNVGLLHRNIDDIANQWCLKGTTQSNKDWLVLFVKHLTMKKKCCFRP